MEGDSLRDCYGDSGKKMVVQIGATRARRE